MTRFRLQPGLAFRSQGKVLTNHQAVSARRCDQKLAHAMRLVCGRLMNQSAALDNFLMERVNIIHAQNTK